MFYFIYVVLVFELYFINELGFFLVRKWNMWIFGLKFKNWLCVWNVWYNGGSVSYLCYEVLLF